MSPKKRHRPGVPPRLNFSFEELREGHQSLAPPPANSVDASYLSNLASSSTQQDTAADKTDDNRGSSTSSVPPKPSLGSRKDAPSFQPSKRFNKQLALSAASSDTDGAEEQSETSGEETRSSLSSDVGDDDSFQEIRHAIGHRRICGRSLGETD